ncbi:DBP2 protein [Gynaephora ruoergensis nucleopolyhedrovirus]|nr:DBP2 protein [Gynaephora ruoergensis nucleopolyhedrovirus]
MHSRADDNDDEKLCIIEAPVLRPAGVLWQDKFLNKLNRKIVDSSTINCASFNNKLKECLAPLADCEPFEVCAGALEVTKKLHRTGGDTYCVSSASIKSTPKCAFFFDKITMTRKTSRFNNGNDYFVLSWPGLHKLNRVYGRALEKYTKAPVTLQTQLYYAVPDYKNNFASLIVFARKFYWVKREANDFLYSSGRLCDRLGVTVQPFEPADVDRHFVENESVSMLMGAVVQGIRQTGKEIEVTDINNSKIIKTKTFALAIKPMLFVAIEQ